VSVYIILPAEMRRGALVGILFFVFWFAGPYLAEEAIFHPIVPVVGALALIVVSMRAMVRDFRLAQVLLASFVILASVTTLWVVKRTVLDRAMGTYLAHYFLLAAIPLATAQYVLSSRRLSGGE
jgi:hypothetical protein